jgi:hypothetical protein
MRVLLSAFAIAGMVLASAGCQPRPGPNKYYNGPTVPAFSGQVVQDGKPVTFPEYEEVRIRCTLTEGEGIGKSFGVPIKPDGTFSIGWMPMGKMALRLDRALKSHVKAMGPPQRYVIPDGLTIEEGKTTGYTIELGKEWHP